jgi:hypothetical protein
MFQYIIADCERSLSHHPSLFMTTLLNWLSGSRCIVETKHTLVATKCVALDDCNLLNGF